MTYPISYIKNIFHGYPNFCHSNVWRGFHLTCRIEGTVSRQIDVHVVHCQGSILPTVHTRDKMEKRRGRPDLHRWTHCCGSGMFPGSDLFPSRIPDPNCHRPGSRIRIEEFKYFNPKNRFLSSRKYDPGCSSRIPDPDADFLPIPDPGSRSQKGTGSRIRIRNTGWIDIAYLIFTPR